MNFPVIDPAIRLVLCGAMTLLLSNPGPVSAEPACTGGITVHTTGEVEATPDIVIITVGVTSQHKEATQALAENSRTVSRVIEKLAGLGIEKRDIKTETVSLQPDYDYQSQPPRLKGYQASNQLGVTLREIRSAGSTLDLLVQEGVNQIQGLRFDFSKRSELLDTARRHAVSEATRKASLLAKEASVAIGNVCSIEESTGAAGSPVFARGLMSKERALASSVPLESGSERLGVDLKINFSLK